jgi:hypothetical protein
MNVQCCPFIAPWAIDKAALVQQKRSWDENLPFMQARPHLSPSPQHLPHSPPPPVPLLVPRKPLLPRNRHRSAATPLSPQPPRVRDPSTPARSRPDAQPSSSGVANKHQTRLRATVLAEQSRYPALVAQYLCEWPYWLELLAARVVSQSGTSVFSE